MLISPSAALEGARGRGGRVLVAVRRRVDAGDEVVGDHPAHGRHHRFQHRHVDERRRAGAFSAARSRIAAVSPPTVSAIGIAHAQRRAVGVAGDRHHARRALHDLVVGRALGPTARPARSRRWRSRSAGVDRPSASRSRGRAGPSRRAGSSRRARPPSPPAVSANPCIGCLRLTVTDFLPAFWARKDTPMPFAFRSGSAPRLRARSPRPGASTLMTSAPRWASWWQQNGPPARWSGRERGVFERFGHGGSSSRRTRRRPPRRAASDAFAVTNLVHRRASVNRVLPRPGRGPSDHACMTAVRPGIQYARAPDARAAGRSPPGGGKRPGQSAAQRPGLQ
jgi:hypothetical protein